MSWRDILQLGTGATPYPVRVQPQVTAWVDRSTLAAVDVFGVDSDMTPVTRAEAMSVPAMARARHLVCGTIPRLPLTVYTTPPDPTTPPLTSYPYRSLIEQPDPSRTRMAVLVDTLDSLIFAGAALWRVIDRYAPDTTATRDSAGALIGRPRSAEYVALDRVTRDDDGTWLIDDRPVPDRDLVWFESFHEGVCSFAGRAVRSAAKLDRAYAANASNPVPALELHQVSDDILTDDEIADLIRAWEDALAGRGVAYTNSAVEARTHGAAPEQLLISGRNAAAVEIARVVSVPASTVDAITPGMSGTYSNTQAKGRDLWDYGLAAYAECVTARLSLDDILPRGTWCAFGTDPLTRADFPERMAGYGAARAADIYTADELRALELGRPLETP